MNHKHPINVVARRSGLSTHLIRMWERRYKTVEPERTESGRRLYSEKDIQRLILLRRATEMGESISQVAVLSDEDLIELVGSESPPAQVSISAPSTGNENADYHLRLCIDATRNLDSVNLESRLLSASVSLGQQVFFEQVLQPLLVNTGEMWSDGRLKVAHEHLGSAVIRSLLGSMVVATRTDSSGPVLLATTPSGQMHEFGALMAAVSAASLGWRTSYLGPNLPAEDIASAAFQRNAAAVAISIVYPSDDPHLPLELGKLGKLLEGRARLIVGGQGSIAHTELLAKVRAIHVNNLTELKSALTEIRREVETQQTG